MRRRWSVGLTLLGVVALLGSGCATQGGPSGAVAGIPPELEYDELFDEPLEADEVEDPFEETNRAIFAGNRGFDRLVIGPISRAYAFVIPDLARRALRRVFVNLNSPAVFVNDLLQLAPRRAGTTGVRFVINSTVGVAGLWDAAERIGLEGHHTDFGITLAKYGVASGPYLVMPLVGPTTARDAFGDLVDILLLPQTWFLGPTTWVFAAYEGADGFTLRDVHRDALEALEESSVDFYVAMRFAYLSNRAAEIHAMTSPPAGETSPEEDEPAEIRGTGAEGGLEPSAEPGLMEGDMP